MLRYTVEGARRKVRNRRNFVLAARSGEGPFTIPFADFAHRVFGNRWFFEFTTYALATRLSASWIEATGTWLARVSARFSKSLARRWYRPKQVRLTTQRCGRTTRPLT